MRLIIAAAAGALFGVGLLVSGMTDPEKVLGFLDVTRRWDPSLAFVMAGAVAVYVIAFARVRAAWSRPLLGDVFHLPERRTIDAPLVTGAALFGAGWGLAGLCPGPAVVVAAAGSPTGLVFVTAMLAGMIASHIAARR